jgi:O-antigen ligase
VSYWFGGGGDANAAVDGNPINTLVFGVLILAATLVLLQRHLNWGAFIQNNKAVCLIYLFFAVSAAWSPLGLVSLKRVIKDFGCVLVALVLLTENDPVAAIRTVFVRVSYLIFPLSVLAIKYYPDIGRNYSVDGGAMATGLTTQKNSLGEIVLVLGLVTLWDLLEMRRENNSGELRTKIRIRYGMLLMGIWLLATCDSVTSIICSLLGLFVLWGGGRLVQMRNGRRVLVYCFIVAACLVGLNGTFGISDAILHAVGRDPTLTDRTYIWQAILDQKTDPLVGFGFYSFWDSEFGRNVNIAMRTEGLNEAHNGYLETFVDGGVVGEGLLVVLLLAVGARSIRRLFDGSLFGRMAFAFWLIAIFSDISEVNFFRLGAIWFTFLLLAIECPGRLPVAAGESAFFTNESAANQVTGV